MGMIASDEFLPRDAIHNAD